MADVINATNNQEMAQERALSLKRLAQDIKELLFNNPNKTRKKLSKHGEPLSKREQKEEIERIFQEGYILKATHRHFRNTVLPNSIEKKDFDTAIQIFKQAKSMESSKPSEFNIFFAGDYNKTMILEDGNVDFSPPIFDRLTKCLCGVRLEVTDISVQPEYRQMRHVEFENSDIIVFCYNPFSDQSLEYVREQFDELNYCYNADILKSKIFLVSFNLGTGSINLGTGSISQQTLDAFIAEINPVQHIELLDYSRSSVEKKLFSEIAKFAINYRDIPELEASTGDGLSEETSRVFSHPNTTIQKPNHISTEENEVTLDDGPAMPAGSHPAADQQSFEITDDIRDGSILPLNSSFTNPYPRVPTITNAERDSQSRREGALVRQLRAHENEIDRLRTVADALPPPYEAVGADDAIGASQSDMLPSYYDVIDTAPSAPPASNSSESEGEQNDAQMQLLLQDGISTGQENYR